MRFALITADQPTAIAGRSLALRQLDFALAAGAERIIALGNGAPAELTALRHRAEGAGARFQPVAGPHALLGLIGAADDLLVIMPGLFAESAEALTLLSGSPAVLTFPAVQGLAGGFERIDQDQAWAGMLVVPGSLVERLAQLPGDSDAPSALLRIALQGRVPLRQVQGEVAGGPCWCRVEGDAAGLQADWLKRHEPAVPPGDITGAVARMALRRFGAAMVAGGRAAMAPQAVMGASLLLAVLLAAWGQGSAGWTVASLVLLAVAAPSARLVRVLDRLGRATIAPAGRAGDGLQRVVDGALLAVLILAGTDDGAWRTYPPLMLMLTLQLPAARGQSWLADRMVVALVLALAASLGGLALAVMALSAIVLTVTLLSGRGNAESHDAAAGRS